MSSNADSAQVKKEAAFLGSNAYKGCPFFVPLLLPSMTLVKLLVPL